MGKAWTARRDFPPLLTNRRGFIDCFPATARRFSLQCPIDQSLLGEICEGDAVEVDAAIAAAERAFPAWSAMGTAQRKPYLDRFAAEIGKRADAFCVLESNDAGVLLSRMRHGVVPRAMLNITWFAEHALSLQDRPIDTDQAHHIVRHDPAGVVAIVTTWNAPLMLSTGKLGPALAAGNTCVLKPPEWAPLTCSLLADAAHAAGLPPGVFNVVQGSGALTGARLVSDPRIARVSFTGSVATAKWIAQAAGANLVPCSLELGGKSPFIVLEDADLDGAAATGALMYRNAGQVCLAGTRLLVHEKVADRRLWLGRRVLRRDRARHRHRPAGAHRLHLGEQLRHPRPGGSVRRHQALGRRPRGVRMRGILRGTAVKFMARGSACSYWSFHARYPGKGMPFHTASKVQS